jgi:hypothetical protein
VIYPEKLPVTTEVESLTKLPDYKSKVEGKVISIEEGEQAEISGILLSEEKAINAGEVRIAYDEIYQLYQVNRVLFLTVTSAQEKALYKSEALVLKKNHQIDMLQNSWWAQNKLMVGVGTGIILGVVTTVFAGWVWAEISKSENDGLENSQ